MPPRARASQLVRYDYEEPQPKVVKERLGQLLTRSQLKDLPRPEPLIDGILGHRSAVLMVGETGTNKTFTAVGFLCSVATGKPWLGRSVLRPAPVLYIVGEGATGLDSRITAWEEEHGAVVADNRFMVSIQPEFLTSEATRIAIEGQAKEMGAGLVVLDTFSSLAPDADETEHAPLVTRWIADFATRHDCSVILVHHTGWGDKGRARGGSQLEANVDEVLLLERGKEEGSVSIKRKKVKDGPAGGVIWVERKPVGPSVVLSEVLAPEEPEKARRMTADDAEQALWGWMRDNPGLTKNFIKPAAKKALGIGDQKFNDAFTELFREKRIESKLEMRPWGKGEREQDVWYAKDRIRVRRADPAADPE